MRLSASRAPEVARYQVVAAMVTATVDTTDGPQVRYYYQGSVLPEGTHQESIDHLLDVGLVVDFDSTPEQVAVAEVKKGRAKLADPATDPAASAPADAPVGA